MNIQQRLHKLEQHQTAIASDLSGLVAVVSSNDYDPKAIDNNTGLVIIKA